MVKKISTRSSQFLASNIPFLSYILKSFFLNSYFISSTSSHGNLYLLAQLRVSSSKTLVANYFHGQALYNPFKQSITELLHPYHFFVQHHRHVQDEFIQCCLKDASLKAKSIALCKAFSIREQGLNITKQRKSPKITAHHTLLGFILSLKRTTILEAQHLYEDQQLSLPILRLYHAPALSALHAFFLKNFKSLSHKIQLYR